jgi:CRISPR system Cascade subunit CasE
VLVQSTAPGEWQRIKERVARVESRECALSVVRGESFRFLLRANPTVRRKGRDEPAFREIGGEAFRSRAGRRVALLRDDDRLDWLDRKAASAGFSIARDRVRLQNTRVWRWHRGDEMARHDGVDFEGILTVTNPASFVAALNSGIGTARAFGFGMLSVARLPR